jgi:hypothetical protein
MMRSLRVAARAAAGSEIEVGLEGREWDVSSTGSEVVTYVYVRCRRIMESDILCYPDDDRIHCHWKGIPWL